MANARKVLMLGPALDKQGGIAAVEHTYLQYWNTDRYEIKHIPCVVDGGAARRIWIFLRAIVVYCYLLIMWKPTVVHSHVAWKGSFVRQALFLSLAKLARRKTIYHSHANRFNVFYENSLPIIQKLIRHVLRSADVVLTVSQEWQSYFQGICPEANTRYLYNPIPFPNPHFEEEHNGFVVLTLGRLGHRKGTYDTLHAIPRVLAQHPNTEFWFGGDGEIENVRRIVNANEWKVQVRILGWVRDEGKENALKRADIFLLPSYHEGLPVAILEAMAFGLPVVSTNVGGISQAVLDRSTGFLVDPGNVDAISDRINLLLSDKQLRRRMGSAGRQHVLDTFEVRKILSQLYTLYDEILDQELARSKMDNYV